MRIELVIDELVLHGFNARERHAIGDAVAEELSRLVAAHATTGGWNDRSVLDAVDAGTIAMPPRVAAATAGRTIAHSIASAVCPVEPHQPGSGPLASGGHRQAGKA